MGRGDAAPTSGDTGGGSTSGSLAQLAALSASAIATLVAVASNPKAWLREFVYELIAEWIVGGILDAASYLLGWLIFAYERTASILLDAAGPLASPFRILEDKIAGAIRLLYDAALGVAQSAGLAGPPAAAFAVALISLLLAMAVYATWRTIPGSDAVGGALEAIR